MLMETCIPGAKTVPVSYVLELEPSLVKGFSKENGGERGKSVKGVGDGFRGFA